MSPKVIWYFKKRQDKRHDWIAALKNCVSTLDPECNMLTCFFNKTLVNHNTILFNYIFKKIASSPEKKETTLNSQNIETFLNFTEF